MMKNDDNDEKHDGDGGGGVRAFTIKQDWNLGIQL